MVNSADRKPNTAMQTGVNQVAIATPLVSLLGWWLADHHVPAELIGPLSALAMAGITTVGTVLRNIAKAEGWTKYVG